MRELSVGEVSRRSGISVSALHFYERKGLIAAERSAGNQRRYPRTVLRRLAVIRAAQLVGIPLSAIASRLDGASEKMSQVDWSKLARDWRADLDRRITLLRDLRDRLDGCIGCGCLSLDECPLQNPQDRLAELGPGAHRLRGLDSEEREADTDRG
ncbi:redox-sensitive transcriptional activator SoxR [Pararhizobium mangrovi]|nr:redox-sensitive transcriptional activator SoxR [Pararhizobium mangrovi]